MKASGLRSRQFRQSRICVHEQCKLKFIEYFSLAGRCSIIFRKSGFYHVESWKDKYHNSFFLLVFIAEHAVSGYHFGQSGSGVLAVPIPLSCSCTSSWAEGTAWGREALTFCKCWSAIAKTWLCSRYRLHHGSCTLKKINSIPEKNKYNLLLSCCSESKFSWRFERSLFFPLLFYVYITTLFCIKAAVFQHSWSLF